MAFTNYNMQGDSMKLAVNTADKGIQSVDVSSYLNNDPKDAVTFTAQFQAAGRNQLHVLRYGERREGAPDDPDPEHELPTAVEASLSSELSVLQVRKEDKYGTAVFVYGTT